MVRTPTALHRHCEPLEQIQGVHIPLIKYAHKPVWAIRLILKYTRETTSTIQCKSSDPRFGITVITLSFNFFVKRVASREQVHTLCIWERGLTPYWDFVHAHHLFMHSTMVASSGGSACDSVHWTVQLACAGTIIEWLTTSKGAVALSMISQCVDSFVIQC